MSEVSNIKWCFILPMVEVSLSILRFYSLHSVPACPQFFIHWWLNVLIYDWGESGLVAVLRNTWAEKGGGEITAGLASGHVIIHQERVKVGVV